MSSPNTWSKEEHNKFLAGLKMFPEGPWTAIATFIGTRSSRQVQTHAQKYYEKVGRRMRGLRKERKYSVRSEHQLGDDMATLCSVPELVETGVRIGQIRRGLKAVATSFANIDASIDAESTEEENWVTASGEQPSAGDTSLDWVDALFDDEELATWANLGADTTSSGEVDALQDVDDCYLNYLIEILDSSDFSS